MGRPINDRARWIERQGTDIIFFDYSSLKGDDYVKQITANVRDVGEIHKDQDGRSLLLLVDISDSAVNPSIMAAFKKGARDLEPYIIATAVIGASGAKKKLIDFVVAFSGLNAKAFNTKEEAESWLLTQL